MGIALSGHYLYKRQVTLNVDELPVRAISSYTKNESHYLG
jgi:hypothetical protein